MRLPGHRLAGLPRQDSEAQHKTRRRRWSRSLWSGRDHGYRFTSCLDRPLESRRAWSGDELNQAAATTIPTDIRSYQAARRKGKWPMTDALNVDKRGGFEPGRTFAAFTELPVARNTVRLRDGIENRSGVCG
jgi:hypothetical protein